MYRSTNTGEQLARALREGTIRREQLVRVVNPALQNTVTGQFSGNAIPETELELAKRKLVEAERKVKDMYEAHTQSNPEEVSLSDFYDTPLSRVNMSRRRAFGQNTQTYNTANRNYMALANQERERQQAVVDAQRHYDYENMLKERGIDSRDEDAPKFE
jgi:hypothetical protein